MTGGHNVPKLIEAWGRRMNTFQERVSELEGELQDAHLRIEELEELVDPDPETPSDELSKDQKVRRVRKALIRDAMESGGRASLKYKEVRALFGNSIAPSYSYDLMESAGEKEGFVYGRSGHRKNGEKRIRVDLDAMNDKPLILSVKNETSSVPA